ncbi:hypothetical protein GIY23_20940 [Allosaccharopolyspora coralli]|uniref:Uncharacterized protein n=1 Tax=Allosaccharopolyspora coralli TaxID=2665642 RepID=A0A5Q3QJE7_9PSEU|nr:proline-rich domain-containing protein [Allosaccharopolyspora coralli]QGK71655.1 hypothetical protein GIY23_20940 [Allosaccharopolyspora coralli]
MTSPQSPWQQGGYQQNPYGTPSGGFPQQAQPGHPGFAAYAQRGYPAPGHPYGAPAPMPTPVPKPQAVEIAFYLAVGIPLFWTIMQTVGYLFMPRVDGPNVMLYGGIAMAVLGLIGATIWIVLGFLMWRGANWARVVLLVLGAIWSVSTLSSLVGGVILLVVGVSAETGVSVGMGVVSLVTSVVTLAGLITFAVLVLRASSNRFFNAPATQRAV